MTDKPDVKKDEKTKVENKPLDNESLITGKAETKLSTTPTIVNTKPPETTGEPSNSPVVKTIVDTRDDNLGEESKRDLPTNKDEFFDDNKSFDLTNITEKDVEFVDPKDDPQEEIKDREDELSQMRKDHQELSQIIEESEKELADIKSKSEQSKTGTFFVYDRDTIVEAEEVGEGDNGVQGTKHLQFTVGGKTLIYKNVRPGDSRAKEVGTFFVK